MCLTSSAHVSLAQFNRRIHRLCNGRTCLHHWVTFTLLAWLIANCASVVLVHVCVCCLYELLCLFYKIFYSHLTSLCNMYTIWQRRKLMYRSTVVYSTHILPQVVNIAIHHNYVFSSFYSKVTLKTNPIAHPPSKTQTRLPCEESIGGQFAYQFPAIIYCIA